MAPSGACRLRGGHDSWVGGGSLSSASSRPLVRLDLTAVAFADEAVVGYSILEELPGRPLLEHAMVAVAPGRRRSGIGSCLLGKQAAAARALGVTALVATPLVDSMLRFYERCGYRPRTYLLGFEGPLLSS